MARTRTDMHRLQELVRLHRLGRDFLIDGELAAMMGRVSGVTDVELKAQEAPRLALVS